MLCFYFSFQLFLSCVFFDFDWYCLFLKISSFFHWSLFWTVLSSFLKNFSLFYEPVQENKSREEITCLCWSKNSCSWTNLNHWSSWNKNHNSDLRWALHERPTLSAFDVQTKESPLRRLGFVRLHKTHFGPKPKTWYSSFSGNNLSVTECRPDSLLAWILENISWNILPVISTWALLD